MRRFAFLLLFATPALAQDPLTADDFDTLTRGRTMTWSEFGAVYGVEQYLPDRQVRWSAEGDDCKLGHWYADGPAICFQYESDPEPDCWIITGTDIGMTARYLSNPPEAEPVVVQETTETPACLGPRIGA